MDELGVQFDAKLQEWGVLRTEHDRLVMTFNTVLKHAPRNRQTELELQQLKRTIDEAKQGVTVAEAEAIALQKRYLSLKADSGCQRVDADSDSDSDD